LGNKLQELILIPIRNRFDLILLQIMVLIVYN